MTPPEAALPSTTTLVTPRSTPVFSTSMAYVAERYRSRSSNPFQFAGMHGFTVNVPDRTVNPNKSSTMTR
jgi:hypothetical protein